ncbi:host cell division inhibitor Icd-like protein [Providencia alcalifaciens]|uniref:host cell division inhibitor Icd-like protein n=1 Tax=Providencia alcalifaciens TaxID=126385 RepID=UPI003D976EBC
MKNTNYQWYFLPVKYNHIFKWVFLAQERVNKNIPLQKIIVFAQNYQEAKEMISKKYVTSLAGKIPI